MLLSAQVADCERLVLAASRRAHEQLRAGKPTIEGTPLDHYSPDTKLRDVMELQPYVTAYVSTQAQQSEELSVMCSPSAGGIG